MKIEMKTKSVISILVFTTLFLLPSCKSEKPRDIVAENFEFAAQQLEYAVMLTEETVNNDTRDSLKKVANPLVSPRTMADDGSLIMVPGMW
jgi:hypothetical protein